MNLLKVIPKDTGAIIPTRILQQTAFWAKFKNNTGWNPAPFDIFESDPVRPGYWIHQGDILILFRELQSGGVIAYAPYGPEMVPEQERQGAWLEELSDAIRDYLPEACFAIRFDLSWPSPWNEQHGATQQWYELPDTPIQEMRMNFGTRNWNLRKSPSNILPSNTVILPLEKDPAVMLGKMKPKTRYNIRLSQRKKISVRLSGEQDLDKWFYLYNQTVKRNRIAGEQKDYFQQVLLTDARDTISPAVIKLLLAETNGTPLAGMFLALSQSRATYLYGASASHHREMMAPYLLQWNAIQYAQQMGCTEYDLFGISSNPDPSNPMYGLYRFKTGFGGKVRHRLGCWDYPFRHDAYEHFRMIEILSPGFHQ